MTIDRVSGTVSLCGPSLWITDDEADTHHDSQSWHPRATKSAQGAHLDLL